MATPVIFLHGVVLNGNTGQIQLHTHTHTHTRARARARGPQKIVRPHGKHPLADFHEIS